MISQTVLATIAKFVAVGGLMAAGAAGVYFVVTKTSDDPSRQVVVAETATPTSTATMAVADATSTPAAGLTDTGYKALDGRPLYAECIQAGAPLPPEFPVPSSTQIPIPTIAPSIDRNEGKATPNPSDLPAFDPRTIAPADTTGWVVRHSACYGYSLAIPPAWSFSSAFSNAGYQQGEDGTLRVSNGTSKIEIGVYYTRVDYLGLNSAASLSESEYLLDGPSPVTKNSAPGIVSYLQLRGELRGVYLSYLFSPRPTWYVSVGVYLTAPYDIQAVQDARALVESISFQ